MIKHYKALKKFPASKSEFPSSLIKFPSIIAFFSLCISSLFQSKSQNFLARNFLSCLVSTGLQMDTIPWLISWRKSGLRILILAIFVLAVQPKILHITFKCIKTLKNYFSKILMLNNSISVIVSLSPSDGGHIKPKQLEHLIQYSISMIYVATLYIDCNVSYI